MYRDWDELVMHDGPRRAAEEGTTCQVEGNYVMKSGNLNVLKKVYMEGQSWNFHI